jgi:hypothetical protein
MKDLYLPKDDDHLIQITYSSAKKREHSPIYDLSLEYIDLFGEPHKLLYQAYFSDLPTPTRTNKSDKWINYLERHPSAEVPIFFKIGSD